MANEAYRAVFLRVHPTGKMVLSLTTDADGNEAAYAQQVGEELGVPALDVKVVPADTDRFGTGHGYNTSPTSAGTAAAISRTTGKIRDKAQLLAGMQLGCRAGDAVLVERRLGQRRRQRPVEGGHGGGHRALRPRHRRAAPRGRGRAGRPDRLQRLSARGVYAVVTGA